MPRGFLIPAGNRPPLAIQALDVCVGSPAQAGFGEFSPATVFYRGWFFIFWKGALHVGSSDIYFLHREFVCP